MNKENLNYRFLTYSDSEHVINLCKRFNIYLENNLINNVCLKKWDDVSTEHIGYGCFDGDSLIGYIGCVQAKRDGYIINDLSCGIVDEKYRGCGIATKLFNMAHNDGDIILDLTPSEQVYQMFKRHFPEYHDLSDFQLWFNCKKLKSNKGFQLYSDKESIIAKVNEKEKKVILNNLTYLMSFALVEFENEYCVVGYYTMKKKKVIKGFEVIYISNPNFFEKYYESIIKLIGKKNKSFFAFVDKRWLPNHQFKGLIMERGTNSKQYIKRMSKLLFKKYIKAPNRKLIRINNEKCNNIQNLDYLYTEMCLYKDLD